MKRNPIYDFKDRNSTGIFDVPLKSTISVADSNGQGKPRLLQIISKNGLNHRSTIGQFLADESLYIDINKANEVFSELEKIQQANNEGWRLLGRDKAQYGYIGQDAIDLSYATGLKSNVGAIGNRSFAIGTDTSARGENSIAEGYKTTAYKNYAHAEGWLSVADGIASHAEGYGTLARNNFMTAAGKFNTGNTPGVLFEVGIGEDIVNRKNAFQIFDDGAIVAPYCNDTLVSIHGPHTLATSQYVDDRITAFSLNDLDDVDLESNLPHPNQVLKYDGTKWTAQADSNSNLVSSVNGDIGDVILNTDDIPEGSTNLYYTSLRAANIADQQINNAEIDRLADVDTTGANIGQVLKWNGTNWTPSNLPAPGGNLKSNGTVPMDTGYIPSGVLDLVTKEYVDTGRGAYNLNELSDVDLENTPPINGQVLKYDGAKWIPSEDLDTTYTADNGVRMVGNEIQLNAGLDDLIDVDLNTNYPNNKDLLQWDGVNWIPYQVQEYNFTASAGQVSFVVTNNAFEYARIYTNGVRDKSDTFTLSNNGTDTLINFSSGKNNGDWILVEV